MSDPLAAIVESCEWVASKASSVSILEAGIEGFTLDGDQASLEGVE